MCFLLNIFLAISLSMDALGIGISYEMRKIKVPVNAKFIISLISLIFTAIAITVGNVIVTIIPQNIAKLVGFFMLISLGFFVIYQSIRGKKNSHAKKKQLKRTWHLAFRSLEITVRIIRDPISCDFDGSSHIDIKEAIYLGTALSIDSFGAGISSAVSGINSFFIPILVGVCQFLALSLGSFFGKKLSNFKCSKSNFFTVLSGLILIILAVVRYFF